MTRLGILGPVMAWMDDATPLALGGPKDRAALTVLALSSNRVCGEAELIDSIWGDDPPEKAGKLLQNQVLRLRRALQAAGEPGLRIVTRPGGYELDVDRDHLDLLDVEHLLEDVREAVRRGSHETAAELAARALSHWRGVALADLGDLPLVRAARPRLEELRLAALEARLEADLACGRHVEVIAELEAATAAEPLRERLWALRMAHALHRAGRQADALRAYQEVRNHLGEELGLEPGPALTALERAIAVHDPDLAWHPRALPGGLVTFMLTDIEGSTQLFHLLGDRYPDVLEEHDRLAQAVFTRYGGVEVKHEGDGFLIAFVHADEAIRAALEMQLALLSQDWPAPLRVRIGIHRGPATPTISAGRSDYVALAVHQVARLCAAGHGEQSLISTSAASAIEQLPEGAALTDLGPYQLRDFPTPEPVFQLEHEQLRARFPPLRSVAVIRHNLLRPRSTFVGRTEALTEVGRLLERTGVVSIVGPGGVGKSRLAVETATVVLPRFGGGVWFVDLAPVADGDLVATTIASVLRVVEVPEQPTVKLLIEHIADQRMLLVLDNCEHLLDSVATLIDAVSPACLQLAILATSRVPLHVDGEAVWRLAPLRAPETAESAEVDVLAGFEAVELFCDRAGLSQPGFVLDDSTAGGVASITARLDGIPLALELAAARLTSMNLEELDGRLTDRFTMLSEGRRSAPARHQTMWAAIDWSFQLLGPTDRQLLAAVACFAGSFDARAAAIVADVGDEEIDERLRRLVDLSLVDVADDRFRLLESVRAFGAEQLDGGPHGPEVRARHAAEFVARAEAAEPHLVAPEPDWMSAIDRDLDNIREAMRWAVGNAPVLAVRLAFAASRVWHFRGRLEEGATWLTTALAAAEGSVDDRLRARALFALGGMTGWSARDRSYAYHSEAAGLFRIAGDDRWLTRTLLLMIEELREEGDSPTIDGLLAEAEQAAARADDPLLRGLLLDRRADVLDGRGDYAGMLALRDECLTIYREHGYWQEVMWSIAGRGLALLRFGDPVGALTSLQEAATMAGEQQHTLAEGWIHTAIGVAYYLTGELETARRELATAAAVCRRMSDRLNGPWALTALARVALAEGKVAEAQSLISDAIGLVISRGAGLQNLCRHAAVLAACCSDARRCARLLGCRSAFAGREFIPAWDEADIRWAEEFAHAELDVSLFNDAFIEGSKADARQFVPEICRQLDPSRSGDSSSADLALRDDLTGWPTCILGRRATASASWCSSTTASDQTEGLADTSEVPDDGCVVRCQRVGHAGTRLQLHRVAYQSRDHRSRPAALRGRGERRPLPADVRRDRGRRPWTKPTSPLAPSENGSPGSLAHLHLAAPITSIAACPTVHGGVWLLGADGGVFALGDAAFYGSYTKYMHDIGDTPAEGYAGAWLALAATPLTTGGRVLNS